MKINVAKVKLLLAKQEATLTQLAENSGVSRQSLSVILNRGTCTPKTANKIARGLGIDVTEIIKEE